MQDLINSIQISLETENWYSALVLSLIVPDICGKLENIISPKNRYIEWFNKYFSQDYKGYLSGEDCYALRCSFLHEGTGNIENQKAKEVVDRIEFIINGPHLNSFSNCQFGDSLFDGKEILILSNLKFCKDVIEATEKWMRDVKENKAIQQNMKNMLSIKDSFTL